MQRVLVIYLLMVLSCMGCADEAKPIHNEKLCGRYELLPETRDFMKVPLVDIFVSIALGSEFDMGVPVIKKWQAPMKVYVTGSSSDSNIDELQLTMQELNALLTDYMSIEMVTDSTLSNMTIFFGEKSDYLFRYPEVRDNFNDAIGFFVIQHDEKFQIESGHIFIDIINTTFKVQRHLIREELTQALGLPNDIASPNSVFYDKPSDTNQYSIEDKEVIRLLYRPEVIPGMAESSVREVIRDLLCI